MDGLIVETAPEAYKERIIKQMYDCAKRCNIDDTSFTNKIIKIINSLYFSDDEMKQADGSLYARMYGNNDVLNKLKEKIIEEVENE